MKVLIILCLVAGAFANCSVNQHYDSCGTACPLTCDNYQNPPKACVLMCNPGCHCDAGYVKTEDGECVLPENCPSKTPECPAHQHYESCGTACPLTCDNYQNPPKACVFMCSIGCHCDAGYVKTRSGECVLPEKCPSQTTGVCGANEQYTGCGTACPLTCENYDNPPKFCNLMCVIGCECAKGYVRSADGRCVLPENCPARTLDRPDCDKAPETGFCRAYFPRFYYDQEAGMCKSFVYGGCGGNRNNFKTEEECYNRCGALASVASACDQEKVVGPCRAAFRRFFFNKQTGQCENFIYGGCHGNDNNFSSRSECESTCVA